jgi:glycosyltransferase involved in cell wall biosynthesis
MVSVILPTYNRAVFLRECIESVLHQTGADLELMVIDDGSVDETEMLVSAFGDKRIRYFRRPHSGYTSRLKNFAIGEASGDIVAFIDSDDVWKAGKLARQLRLLEENPGIGFSITDITVFRDDTILKESTYPVQGTVECTNIFSRLVRNHLLIYNPTLVIRRACFGKTGLFNENMRSGDHDFNMRLAYHFDAGIIYQAYLMRRVHASNMSDEMPMENYAEYLHTFGQLYRDKWIGKNSLRRAKGNAFYKMGAIDAGNGRTREARRHFCTALKNDPLHTRAYRALLKNWLWS